MKNKIETGIYIHIPFCVSKCVYCDFLSAPMDDATKAQYVQALCQEIKDTAAILQARGVVCEVPTIFMGGGTPSIFDSAWIGTILDTVYQNFSMQEHAEITIECNPGTLDSKKAQAYRTFGINRLSFGMQSADNTELRLLGRIHTKEQFLESFRIARNAGFDNINIDIMSALPGQTMETYMQTLQTVLSCQPEHISAYSLIVEEGTPLCENLDNYPPLPDEDTEREMYYKTIDTLKKAGYMQYEISNFAKDGYACRHNLSYWERKNYLGFGIGAASLFAEHRYTNQTDLQEYIHLFLEREENRVMQSGTDEKENEQRRRTRIRHVHGEVQTLSLNDQMEEYFFLGLRKTAGVCLTEFEHTYHKNAMDIYGAVIQQHIDNGLLERHGDNLRLTPRGVDISNTVMADFIL